MYPKPAPRIIDPEVLRWVVEERDRTCVYGFMRAKFDECRFGLDPHHLIPRSQGGDDVPENIITLCRHHHDMAEQNTITLEELRDCLEELYGGEYGKS